MKLLCIDGNSVLNRAFYGIKLLTTKDGRYTNAVYGFMNIFMKLLDELQPERVAVAFDVPGGNFRKDMYDGYKANRKGMPEELVPQHQELRDLLQELGYAVVTAPGYEADDILGTISALCDKEGIECRIATGDKDSLQLVSPGTHVLLTTTHFGRGETEEYDEAAVAARYGVTPTQFIDVKALMGDTSDNIPGVAGVGEKTATALIAKFGSLEGVYENIEDPSIKPGVRAKLQKDRDMAFLSRELATINKAVPDICCDLEGYKKTEGDPAAAAARLVSLEMVTTLNKLGLASHVGEAPHTEETKPEPPKALCPAECPEGYDFGSKVFLLYSREGSCAVTDDGVFRLRKGDLRRVFEDENIEKYCDDSKAIRKLAMSIGCELKNVVFDAALAGYLLNPASNDYSIARLAAEYGAGAEFTCEDEESAGLLRPLCGVLMAKLSEDGMLELLRDIELPLVKVLCEMEDVGFLLDLPGIKAFGEELAAMAAKEEEEIYLLAGGKFNINSPKQMSTVLFEKLGLPSGKKTKSGYSTSAEVLERLRPYHPIIDHIFAYRKYVKLLSTYVEGLTKAADAEGRVHTEFHQTETRTGRISSREPNLQNIPVRTELGSRMRKFFKAREGYVLLDADYSQIELRVLAHMSDDDNMKAAFGEGRDVHTETASLVFEVPTHMVTSELRRRAKAVNFGIVYGIGAYSLSQDIDVSVAEAAGYIESYFGSFSGIKNYLESTVENAQRDGYVKTMFGRRRSIPELHSSNKNIQGLGKRLAMNTPVQGSAADIIKIAMIRVSDRLRAEGLDARLILQVHDELIIEASEKDKSRAAELLQYEMEHAAALSVALTAEVGEGSTWFDAK